MKRSLLLLVLFLSACPPEDGEDTDGGPADAGGSGKSLADFLPSLPAPDGTARATFAGPITDPRELIAGPAATGLVGDFYIRNSRARFVIQAAERSIGIVPFGGNVIDAVPLAADGSPAAGDQFGELGMIYLAGRTCNHTKVEVLRDGTGGGPAVIRASGKTAINDYVNLRGLGAIPIPNDVDPDYNEDGVGCATTYTLVPDSDTLDVAWTLFNPGTTRVKGPFGMLNDSGGEIQIFAPGLGFSHLAGSFDSLLDGSDRSVPYQVYHGPGVAYGFLPQLASPDDTSAGLVIAGAAILMFHAHAFLDVLNRELDFLNVPPGEGDTKRVRMVVTRDGAGVDAAYRKARAETLRAVSGRVSFTPSGAAARARVTVYEDAGNDGQIGAMDRVLTYFETDAEGRYAGALPAGKLLLRADVPDVARSAVAVLAAGSAAVEVPPLELPEPARFDFTVIDDADPGRTLPVKITVLGRSTFPRDTRVEQTTELRFGLAAQSFAIYGTSMPAGVDPGDAPISLPAGGPYRIYFSRGPEWSIASVKVEAVAGQRTVLPQVRLRRVIDTTGYVATAFHEHAMGSPDSPVPFEKRLASLLVEGIELFASTDHDYLADYDPLIDAAGLRGLIDAVVGVESTPFAYGHFNAYPLNRDDNDPSGGAIDWGRGPRPSGARLPGEIFADMRARGARIVQASHPRSGAGGFSTFQGYFFRAGLTFDFAARGYGGVLIAQDLPSEWLRLPEDKPIFSDDFNAIELWNNFSKRDTNGDGVVELTGFDLNLRDYMNFLSFGKSVVPVGNSDAHLAHRDVAGWPRTLVRVSDDSETALGLGLDEEVWRTLEGTTARDVVVTSGPHLAITGPGEGAPSLIGSVVAAQGGEITLSIVASSADWVDLDTVEVFANQTFDKLAPGTSTALTPYACFTTRTPAATDPCRAAPYHGGAQPLTVTTVAVGEGFSRREARVTLTLHSSDIPVRAGATGSDAWLFVRARGQRGVFPAILDDAVNSDTLDTFLDGDPDAVRAVLVGRGAMPSAMTAPVFLDFDGGGYRAPFKP